MATAFNSPKRSGMATLPEPGPALAPLTIGAGAVSPRGPAAPAATPPHVPPLTLHTAPSATDLIETEQREYAGCLRCRSAEQLWRALHPGEVGSVGAALGRSPAEMQPEEQAQVQPKEHSLMQLLAAGPLWQPLQRGLLAAHAACCPVTGCSFSCVPLPRMAS